MPYSGKYLKGDTGQKDCVTDDDGQPSPIEERQHFRCSRSVTPIPHELQGDSEHGKDLNTSCTHAVICVVGGFDVKRARRVAVCEDDITLVSQRQR